jgi:hypothetical protein
MRTISILAEAFSKGALIIKSLTLQSMEELAKVAMAHQTIKLQTVSL